MSQPANDNVIKADFRKKMRDRLDIHIGVSWQLLYIDDEVAVVRLSTEVAGKTVVQHTLIPLHDLQTEETTPTPAA